MSALLIFNDPLRRPLPRPFVEAVKAGVATVAKDLIENGLGEARTKKFAILLLHAFFNQRLLKYF